MPSDVLHGEHALQKLRLDLAQLEHAGGTAFLGRLRQYGGNVVVAVDVDHVKLVVRRVDGQLVAELADAFVVQNIAIAPQHEAGLIAGQGSSDGDEAALRLGVDVLYPQAGQEIEGLDQIDLARLERARRIHGHVEGVVEGLPKILHRQQRATTFHVQHVFEQVVVLGLLRQGVQQIALSGRATQLQVVQGVFVTLDANNLYAVRLWFRD